MLVIYLDVWSQSFKLLRLSIFISFFMIIHFYRKCKVTQTKCFHQFGIYTWRKLVAGYILFFLPNFPGKHTWKNWENHLEIPGIYLENGNKFCWPPWWMRMREEEQIRRSVVKIQNGTFPSEPFWCISFLENCFNCEHFISTDDTETFVVVVVVVFNK